MTGRKRAQTAATEPTAASAAPPAKTPAKKTRVRRLDTAAGQQGKAPSTPPTDFDEYFAAVEVTMDMLGDYLRIAARRLEQDQRTELWADQAIRVCLDQTIRVLQYYQGLSDNAVIDLAFGEVSEGVSA
jgi:hypothetical protein